MNGNEKSMVVSKSEKLQFVGTKCMQSLALENAFYQEALLRDGGADHLVRLLRLHEKSATSERVVLATVETMAALCIDEAHMSNNQAQVELADRGALKLLLDLMDRYQMHSDWSSRTSRRILIAAAYALACLMLNRRDVDDMVEQRLNLRLIVALIDTDDLV